MTISARKIRKELATLYPNGRSAKVFTADADIRDSGINFETNPDEVWKAILDQAGHQGKFGHMVEIIQEDYPLKADLIAGLHGLAQQSGDPVPIPAQPAPVQPASRSIEDVEEEQFLRKLLSRHVKNQRLLREQIATFADGEAPISLFNKLEGENNKIAEIKAELSQYE